MWLCTAVMLRVLDLALTNQVNAEALYALRICSTAEAAGTTTAPVCQLHRCTTGGRTRALEVAPAWLAMEARCLQLSCAELERICGTCLDTAKP